MEVEQTIQHIFNSTHIHHSLRSFSKWFWNPDFWLPVNFTWEDIRPREDFNFPDTQDILYYPLYITFILLFIRVSFTKCFKIYYGEKVAFSYKAISKDLPVSDLIINESKTSNKINTKIAHLEKIADSWYMLLIHTFFFVMGFFVLRNKEWYLDIENCWYKYPYHEVEKDIWFYYMFALGFSLSNSIYQMIQQSRKDRVVMYAHHLCTQLLLIFSWTMNFIRAGSLVLYLHHCVDWLLLSAKICHYLKKDKLKHLLFIMTVIVWIITRLILYPFWIIKSAIIDGPKYMFMPSAYLFYSLLIALLFMHMIWMKMMIIIIIKRIKSGKLEDIRSSDEESETESESSKKKDS